MKKVWFRFIAGLIISLLTLTIAMPAASAESANYIPYEPYTYWDNMTSNDRKEVYNRPLFDVKDVFGASDLGISPFEEAVDVCTDKSGNVYILDSASRIVILNSSYQLLGEINEVKGDASYSFEKATSIYVHSDETIYICDTENKRVLHCDRGGMYIDEFVLPESPLIPEDFDFRPIRVIADSKNYVYILSQGSYYGALLYAPDKSFIGFYGANTVTNGIIGALQSLFERMFPNNAKKSNSERKLPYTFADIVIDQKDFIYTATDSAKKGQIKKLSPGEGSNIIDSNEINFTDNLPEKEMEEQGENLKQIITGIAVDDNGFMYLLDSTYGRIFLYDSECRMITAFGAGIGNGSQKGSFTNACAIALNGDDVLICDKGLNKVTVFSKNEYGSKVTKLNKMTISGDYAESKEGWEEVLKSDRNLQIAYTGISRSYIAEGKYKEAMELSLEGYDRETYALAYEFYRTQWLSDNFIKLFSVMLLLSAAIITVFVFIKKKKIVLIKNGELKLMFSTLTHPSNAFEEIKDNKRGSIKLAAAVLLCFYVTEILRTMTGGFLFTNYDPGTFNSFWVFVRSAGLVFLWVASNWLVCSLSQGKGRINEIIIVTCYSLIPLIIEKLVWTFLSNFLLPSEQVILGIISAAAIIYALIIFVCGMLRIHDYTMSRFIGTSLLTVFGMCAILFLIVLIVILVQQTYGFFVTLFIEVFM